jgi:hypothetical protein
VIQPDLGGSSRTRSFWSRFLATADEHEGVLEAIAHVMAPDARIHLQNGEVGDAVLSNRHIALSASAFPDMVVDVEDVLFPDERLVIQVRMSGHAGQGIPFLQPGHPFTVLGCVIGRISEALTIEEMWTYVNPGFAFAYPPSGLERPDPPSDAAGVVDAQLLYDTWVSRAEAGEDFVSAIAATIAPGGAVHIGNGDVGGAELLRELFGSIVAGLPDLSLVIDDVILHHDRVVVQFSTSGTHRGPLGIYPATGLTLPGRGCIIAAANRAGQAARLWVYVAPGYALTLPPSGGLR